MNCINSYYMISKHFLFWKVNKKIYILQYFIMVGTLVVGINRSKQEMYRWYIPYFR